MSEPSYFEMLSPDDVRGAAADASQEVREFVLAHRVDVVDVPSCQVAVRFRKAIGEKQKTIIARLAKGKSWAHGLHKWICDLESEALRPLMALDTELRAGIQIFTAQEDQRRRDEEARLAVEQREAEQARVLAEAANLEAQGETELAAAVVEQALVTPAPSVTLPDVRHEVQGLKTRREWKWRYAGGPSDVTKTPPPILARSFGLIPRDWLRVDESRLTKYASTMKERAVIPGIQFYYEDVPIR